MKSHVRNVDSMAKLITIKCLILILFTQNVASYTIMPVLILDPHAVLRSSNGSHPFRETTSNAFTEIIHDAIHGSDSILIFVEDEFCVEDISTKDAYGTPYNNLRRNLLDQKLKYIPNVAQPLSTLQKLLPPLESNSIYVVDSIKSFDKKFKYHYLYFADRNPRRGTRVQMLRRHDELMKEAYDKLRLDYTGPVVMFYTGKTNPMKGVGRTGYARPEPSYPADGMLMVTDNALIRLTGVMLQQQSSRSLQLATSIASQSFARSRLATRMTYGEFELDFNFEYLSNSWLLDSVVLLEGGEEVGRTAMGVGAPFGYSYFCSEPLMIVNTRDKSYVTISKYQLEPLYSRRRKWPLRDPVDEPEDEDPVSEVKSEEKDTNKKSDENDDGAGGSKDTGGDGSKDTGGDGSKDTGGDGSKDTGGDGGSVDTGGSDAEKTSFTNTVNCGTNFNCRILTGLFVAGMVLSITLYGIMMMYDCASNNRFDDANQKPLVIVAQL